MKLHIHVLHFSGATKPPFELGLEECIWLVYMVIFTNPCFRFYAELANPFNLKRHIRLFFSAAMKVNAV